MSTLVEDLRETKSRIDTPEKWADSSLISAMLEGRTIARFNIVRTALKAELPDGFDTVTGWARDAQHSDIMALFDRAISKASSSIQKGGE